MSDIKLSLCSLCISHLMLLHVCILITSPVVNVILYSGKLSREKTVGNKISAEKTFTACWKITFLQRKLLRITADASNMFPINARKKKKALYRGKLSRGKNVPGFRGFVAIRENFSTKFGGMASFGSTIGGMNILEQRKIVLPCNNLQ